MLFINTKNNYNKVVFSRMSYDLKRNLQYSLLDNQNVSINKT